MRAYYNENDQKKAAWLRELIQRDLIAQGDIDERSITEVQPADLTGYSQCHFFAGIGVWSYALRCAGWPDDWPIWTGSCPCQPFSTAGKGAGAADARHLWPAWFRLIRECHPERIFGEQVAAAIRHGWLDLVSTDLEAEGYALGACVLGAHSVGAPHQRQRCYFVVEPEGAGRWANAGAVRGSDGGVALGDTIPARLQRHGRPKLEPISEVGAGAKRHVAASSVVQSSLEQVGLSRRAREPRSPVGIATSERCGETRDEHRGRSTQRTSDASESNFWSACDWLPCRDGKSRPVEPGTFPLAHGAPARVVRLRSYGDAIVAPLAQAFIEAYLDVSAP